MKSEKLTQKHSCLSSLQKALLELLRLSKVRGDALVGNMLMLKDSVQEQEEMILFIWDNRPIPEEIDKKLVEIVGRRNT